MIAKSAYLKLLKPDFFVGATIQKINTFSTCISFEDYINKRGESVKILVWECELKKTGEKIIVKTSFNKFRITDLPSRISTFRKKQNEQNYSEE
jgi:hypothetical protein